MKIVKRKSPDKLRQIHYVSLTDPVKFVAGKPIPTVKAWSEFGKILTDWPDGLGNISTWGTNDVLVLDSMTFMGKAAMRFILSLNGRAGELPQLQDYRDAQALVERALAAIYSESVKCNVLVLSHITEFGREETSLDAKGRAVRTEISGTRRAYAESGTGKALSPAIGRYFNAVLATEMIGQGTAARYVIKTRPYRNLTLKTTDPEAVKAEYPLATGLADYFRDVREN